MSIALTAAAVPAAARAPRKPWFIRLGEAIAKSRYHAIRRELASHPELLKQFEEGWKEVYGKAGAR